MTGETPDDAGGFPQAHVRTVSNPLKAVLRSRSRFWWLTGASIVVALTLTFLSLRQTGTPIKVSFEQGYGIKPGDRVRHRGIEVGEVQSVNLHEDLDGIEVQILLYPHGAQLARVGSDFWIERPQLSLPRISGIETAVGGKYVRVRPGPPSAARSSSFVGREYPSAIVDSDGIEITIRFDQGHGLVVGDFVRHRGINVGEVSSVQLNSELTGVTVVVQLESTAQSMARAGTLFWIERPKVSLSEVTGLETLVGGRYIAVQPGPNGAEMLTMFDGRDSRPASMNRSDPGLEVILESPHRHGVQAGAPVSFRGLQVGQIVSVALSTDSTSIESHAYIEPAFRSLVRQNSRFWVTSGFDFKFGLTGIDLSADTLATIAAGGVSFATPDDPGGPVKMGERFDLEIEKEIDDPLSWKPRLPSGVSLLPEGSQLPRTLRASLTWNEQGLLRRKRHSSGFVVPLSDGRLLGPRDVLVPPEEAIEGSVRIELEGGAYEVSDQPELVGDLAICSLIEGELEIDAPWPMDRKRHPESPEDCLIVFGAEQRILTAIRVEPIEVGWKIDPSYPIDAQWHGACLIAIRDGLLVGMLVVEERTGKAHAALVP